MTNNNIEPVFEKGYPNFDAVNKTEGYYDYMLRESREADRKIYMENKVQRSIWVTFKKEGIHKYPAALEDPKLATGDEYDVSECYLYLGNANSELGDLEGACRNWKIATDLDNDDARAMYEKNCPRQ